MTAPPRIPAALCGLYPGAPTHVARSRGETYGRTSSFHAPSATEEGRAIVEFAGETMDTCLSGVSLILDSPLALCHAARWLAQRRGHPPVSTAPEWSVEWDSDGALCWRLRSGDEADWFPAVDTDLTDAQALAAACVAAGGAS